MLVGGDHRTGNPRLLCLLCTSKLLYPSQSGFKGSLLAQAETDPLAPAVLRNRNGVQAEILPVGAIIHRLLVPDANGKADDIVLGFDDAKTYEVGLERAPLPAEPLKSFPGAGTSPIQWEGSRLLLLQPRPS